MTTIHRVLIAGRLEPEHVGAHFFSAARQLKLDARAIDLNGAWSRSIWLNRLSRRLLQRRPVNLSDFGRQTVEVCREFQPQLLLVTGIAAPPAFALRQARELGVRCVNFLTDDPWNPAMSARFFWPALGEYDVVFSPRRANIDDLRRHGCRRVEYLPFAYNPEFHYSEAPTSSKELEQFSADVVIIGGADPDRTPLAIALARAGLRLALYGSYWNRTPELRPFYKGFAYGDVCRKAICGATVNIGLVRRANRDGHAMRSLELPAMQACMVVEDTREHRELFGKDGECIEYYTNHDELVCKVQALCQQTERARELGERVYRKICVDTRNSYADRLRKIIEAAQ